jgi:heme/copper-type cytochrome/quinol oxidase subunit 2
MSAVATFLSLRSQPLSAEQLIKKKSRSQRMHDVTLFFSAVLSSLMLTLFVTIVRAMQMTDQPGNRGTVYLRIRDLFLELSWQTVPIAIVLGLLVVLIRHLRRKDVKKEQ